MSGYTSFLYNQLFIKPTLPTTPFTDQTVIITGSNTGLGLEAARHVARLNAHKIILAVRNLAAGEAAARDIEASTPNHRPGLCEVWELDLASYDSVIAFAERVNRELPRVDAVIENAAIFTGSFQLVGGHERSVTVNVISTFLLALLLLPKLRETARMFVPRGAPPPRLTIVVSEVHAWTEFPQWKDERGVFVALSDEATARMGERYQTSKLLDVLVVRELVARMRNAEGDGRVVVNMVNPGLCHSQLARENGGLFGLGFALFKMVLARSTEVGGRTLVAGAAAGEESHGQYMTNGVVCPEALSPFVRSDEGGRAGRRVWEELMGILEGIKEGVTKVL